MIPTSGPPIRVTIIGGGLSGISQAIQLRRQLGNRVHLTIVEKEHAAGGTWLNSTWPGAGVDIPIHLYSLYSDPKNDWETVFADQKQVLDYLNECIVKNGLQDSFIFETEYIGSTWDSASQTHKLELRSIQTGTTSQHTTDVLISANGPLSVPLLPRIPGLSKFKGPAFHNLHWRRNPIDFVNKRVAIVGNGSSGIQLLPGVAATPGVQLVQYIRSGGYYFPKNNAPIPSFRKWTYRYIPFARLWHRYSLFDAHNERWKTRNAEDSEDHGATEKVLLDYLKDTAPAEYLDALTPKYPLGCKRPAYDAGWLAALHRPNVELNSVGIKEITETSIIDNQGNSFDPDVIIFATGSDVARHGVGLNVGLRGEDGKELKELWEEIGGPQSYQGLAVPGFPNYFITLGPNAIAGSWGFTIGNQTTVIARLVKEMVDYDIGSLQPDRSVFDEHNRKIQDELSQSTMNSNACVSWWKIGGGGRLSVPNPLDAVGLWKSTRSTDWSHWIAHSKPEINGNEKPTRIDVNRRAKEKLVKQTATSAAAITVIGTVCWYASRTGLFTSLSRAG